MTTTPEAIAASQAFLSGLVAGAVDRSTNQSARSQQAQNRRLGVSDIGRCREYVRRVIVGEEGSQTPHAFDLAAFIGTAVGDHLEDAFMAVTPEMQWTKQAEVEVQLEVRGFRLRIPGHPDLFSRTSLIDFKTRDGLAVVRRTGPSNQERFQRALYAAALIRDGRMDEECMLHNVYVDRSGADTIPVVWSEWFSWAIVAEAEEWLADVIYAVENNEEAPRDKPREWCWAACQFAPKCRGVDDTDVEGLITDPIIVEATHVYAQAQEQIKAANKDKASAASVLDRVSGVTSEYTIRWVEVGPTTIPEQDRAGYRRLDLRPVKRGKQHDRRDDVHDAERGVVAAGVAGPEDGPGGEAAVGSGAEE